MYSMIRLVWTFSIDPSGGTGAGRAVHCRAGREPEPWRCGGLATPQENTKNDKSDSKGVGIQC